MERAEFNDEEKKMVLFLESIDSGIVSFTQEGSPNDIMSAKGTDKEILYHLSRIIYAICKERDYDIADYIFDLFDGVLTMAHIEKIKPDMLKNLKII